MEKKLFQRMYNFLSLPRQSRWISRPTVLKFLFVGLDEERNLQKEIGYTRRISSSHFECCHGHKEKWRKSRKNKTRSSHM